MNDFSRGGSGLCIPGAQQLYGIGYSGGARIHTNSWGSPFTAQGYYSTADTDNYLHRNPVSRNRFAFRKDFSLKLQMICRE
jgi:hypothetical protein